MVTTLLVMGSFLFGVGLTRLLMQPQLCPRCGAYMRSRGREVADWLVRQKQNREGVPGEGSPERKRLSGEENGEGSKD